MLGLSTDLRLEAAMDAYAASPFLDGLMRARMPDLLPELALSAWEPDSHGLCDQRLQVKGHQE